jgi:uncharacterized membrane protein YcaP (DUF421 family)
MQQIYDFIDSLLGLNEEELTFIHMSMRGIVVYFFGMLLLQINRQIIDTRSPFNFILFIMLGTILATAITGHTPFFSVIGMTFVLTIVNWILLRIAFHIPWLEKLLKGSPIELVIDGTIQWDKMKRHAITERDLLYVLRTTAGSRDIEKIEKAFLESSGVISIIVKK